MGILHTNKVGSTEMAKALGISLSKLQSLQKKNKFTNGSDYYTMATGKNGSGRKIIWSRKEPKPPSLKARKESLIHQK